MTPACQDMTLTCQNMPPSNMCSGFKLDVHNKKGIPKCGH